MMTVIWGMMGAWETMKTPVQDDTQDGYLVDDGMLGHNEDSTVQDDTPDGYLADDGILGDSVLDTNNGFDIASDIDEGDDTARDSEPEDVWSGGESEESEDEEDSAFELDLRRDIC